MPDYDPHYISALGWFHLLFCGVLMPFFAWRGRRKVQAKNVPPLNRVRHFRSTALALVLFGGLSIFTAREQWIDLFPREFPSLWACASAVMMYVVIVMVMKPRWRRAVENRMRVVHLFMPDNAAERAWWITVAILAGVSEEITWRGVQFELLDHLVRFDWIAMALCAAMFGLAHIIQGWKSAAIITIFALGFHALVLVSGSLYLAMIVHAAYDIHAGLAYGRLGRELGYKLDAPAPA